ncbi:hypothetical protein BS47DRAFT_1483053 [Hydnum rufescens UP504]|uniref:U6 snRNA-associated Sm-like protein LSm6 n=1 Tax=Hydnum rufescens UP504 TaxID=1448309 RepID=A0A9P6E141_9AGAM|nr:hypothetical protein BS47DRAFT_1483053 [Hydnum rufescens UP504]
MPSAASCGFPGRMLCIPVLIRFRLEVFVGSYRPSYNMSQQHLVISSTVHVAIDNTNGAMHQSERTIWNCLLAGPPSSGSPTDFLKNVVGKRVVVRLVSGVDYRGVLSCLDGFMNIALEQTEEHVNGRVTNRYGDAFIRGNNVLYISAAETL